MSEVPFPAKWNSSRGLTPCWMVSRMSWMPGRHQLLLPKRHWRVSMPRSWGRMTKRFRVTQILQSLSTTTWLMLSRPLPRSMEPSKASKWQSTLCWLNFLWIQKPPIKLYECILLLNWHFFGELSLAEGSKSSQRVQFGSTRYCLFFVCGFLTPYRNQLDQVGFWFMCLAQDPPAKKEPKAKAKAKSVAAPAAAEWSSLGDASAEFWLGHGNEPAVSSWNLETTPMLAGCVWCSFKGGTTLGAFQPQTL